MPAFQEFRQLFHSAEYQTAFNVWRQASRKLHGRSDLILSLARHFLASNKESTVSEFYSFIRKKHFESVNIRLPQKILAGPLDKSRQRPPP